MRISRITATPVRLAVPAQPYATEGAGTKLHWDGRRSRIAPKRPDPILEYVVVRIETDDGLTGVGEAQADIGFFGQTVEGIQSAVEDYLGPQLIHKDPFDREFLLRLIDYRNNSCARAGIDLALHDLVGKALGVPVGVLLGGIHKRRIAVALEIAGGPAEEMAANCVHFMERGVRAFKAKVGAQPEADAERLCAIREAVGPGVSLRADANQGYSPKEAVRFCRLIERGNLGLEVVEQPVPAWDLQGMASVRSSVDVPIEADESCYSIHDAIQIVRTGAADVLNIKISKAGGLYNAKRIASIAEAAGLGCVLGTAYGLGCEISAKLQLAASTAGVDTAVEFTELGLHQNLLAPPHDASLSLPLSDGCLPVPDGPGLGVSMSAYEPSGT